MNWRRQGRGGRDGRPRKIPNIGWSLIGVRPIWWYLWHDRTRRDGSGLAIIYVFIGWIGQPFLVAVITGDGAFTPSQTEQSAKRKVQSAISGAATGQGLVGRVKDWED